MNQIRQYRPAFFTGYENVTVDFDTVEELLAIPFVRNFVDDELVGPHKFLKFSISKSASPEHDTLIAEYKDGREWLVVGVIRDPLPDGALPAWRYPEKEQV